MTIGCCEVGGGGGGVIGSVGVVCGDGVDNGVGEVVCGVLCGVVKAPISTMIVSVPEKDRWCGTRGKFVRWKGVRVTKASKRAKVGVRVPADELYSPMNSDADEQYSPMNSDVDEQPIRKWLGESKALSILVNKYMSDGRIAWVEVRKEYPYRSYGQIIQYKNLKSMEKLLRLDDQMRLVFHSKDFVFIEEEIDGELENNPCGWYAYGVYINWSLSRFSEIPKQWIHVGVLEDSEKIGQGSLDSKWNDHSKFGEELQLEHKRGK
ncbi:hypothetical protein Tco_1402313 [Tanacetum coccineum]